MLQSLLNYQTLQFTLPLAYLLDLALGDPRGWPHPVRGIGWLVTRGETVLRRRLRSERLAGLLLVVVVLLITGLVVTGVLAATGRVAPWARAAVELLLLYWGLATRSLAGETLRVARAADREDWVAARQELAMIVGRDTETLSPEAIHRACIETVAENTTDAVVSPLCFAAIGGPVALWLFKAASTMDSMVGHRDERYLQFGWAAARLDDLVNFIPARITFLVIPLAALCTGAHPRAAWRIGWRDGRKHPSPNAGLAEAVFAGGLQVQLGGPALYQGQQVHRPWLGDPVEQPRLPLVRRAIEMMLVASLLTLGAIELAFLLFA
jgi:adenosylcobinamide-phosphate synthase